MSEENDPPGRRSPTSPCHYPGHSALTAAPADQLESPIDLERASYFLSTIDFEIAEQPSMPTWRTLLFLGTTALDADAALAFELPRDRTVVIGSRISV